ncbi:MAG: transcriptional regulator [Actinobacteria bacterium]|nr:transcriptional regulator [Actinomycetota bacterium]
MLTAHRYELGRVAARLYPEVPRVASADLLCREEWVPSEPLRLDDLALHWDDGGPDRGGDHGSQGGAGTRRYAEASRGVRPVRPDGGRYASYTEAVAALDRPELFENRPCYRLLDARLTAPARLRLGETSYFDGIDLGHAVAHELAAAWERAGDAVRMADLPLRSPAGDPCALPRRRSLIAVTTLTLRRDAGGEASFVLHWRDPAKVNHGGGLYQVMPVGLFQPVTSAAVALRHDLDLWKSMAREYSEEFLGTSEDYQTSGGLLDYDAWPFYRRLTGAMRAGRLTVHCLGLGVDPLSFATDLLAVAVFDAGLFDAEFAGLVTRNAEGRVITGGSPAGIPFTADTVARLTDGREPFQAAGAALLRLAWEHRTHLLG